MPPISWSEWVDAYEQSPEWAELCERFERWAEEDRALEGGAHPQDTEEYAFEIPTPS